MIKHFQNFKRYAFRLELLQEYNVPDEYEQFQRFLKTGNVIKNLDSEFRKIINDAKNRNAIMSRVHVVNLPLSDYLKFEIKLYKFNNEAGESIFLLNRDYFESLNPDINHDFWLFDNEIVLKMNYDEKGHFIRFEEIKKNIKKYINLKNKLLSISKDFNLWSKNEI